MSDLASLKIGQIIMDEQSKDAIHIAIAPVTASHRLYPGQPIALGNEGFAYGPPAVPVGIVDPFLTKPIEGGQRFWMFLHPGTITSLRHEWTHPAFKPSPLNSEPEQSTSAQSESFCREVAEDIGVDYDEMMRCIKDGDYINMGQNENYKDILGGERYEDFKKHVSIILGKEVDYTYPFSCSC